MVELAKAIDPNTDVNEASCVITEINHVPSYLAELMKRDEKQIKDKMIELGYEIDR